MIRIALALLLALAPLPALAGAEDAVACNPEGNQLQLNACAGAELAAAQAELDATWEQVQQLHADEDHAVALSRLQAAHELWLQLLEADLAAQFPLAEGQDPRVMYGSMYPMSLALARAGLTRQRTAWLRATILEGQ